MHSGQSTESSVQLPPFILVAGTHTRAAPNNKCHFKAHKHVCTHTHNTDRRRSWPCGWIYADAEFATHAHTSTQHTQRTSEELLKNSRRWVVWVYSVEVCVVTCKTEHIHNSGEASHSICTRSELDRTIVNRDMDNWIGMRIVFGMTYMMEKQNALNKHNRTGEMLLIRIREGRRRRRRLFPVQYERFA